MNIDLLNAFQMHVFILTEPLIWLVMGWKASVIVMEEHIFIDGVKIEWVLVYITFTDILKSLDRLIADLKVFLLSLRDCTSECDLCGEAMVCTLKSLYPRARPIKAECCYRARAGFPVPEVATPSDRFPRFSRKRKVVGSRHGRKWESPSSVIGEEF